MNGRRFYVIVADGERGPFTHDELRAALDAGEITRHDQVRSGMGTALGTVGEVISRSSSAARPVIGQTTDGLPPVRVFRPVPLIILGVSVIPAVLLLVLLRGRDEAPAPVNPPEPTPSPVAAAPTIPTPPPITTPAPPKPAPSTPSTTPTVPKTQQPGVTTKPSVIRPEADGRLVMPAATATLSGPDLTRETTAIGISLNGWQTAANHASWQFENVKTGTYLVVARYACPDALAGGEIDILVRNLRKLRCAVKGTGPSGNPGDITLGTITLQAPGARPLSIVPVTGPVSWRLFSLSLIPQ